jgi:hypothetical protein
VAREGRVVRYAYDKACDPHGLRDELLAGGVPVGLVQRDPADAARTFVDVPDERYDAAGNPLPGPPEDWADETAAIVAAHDPAVYEQREADAHKSYDDAVQFLKTYYKTPNAQITVDQSKNAIKALTVLARTQHQALAQQDA